ncbi:MAG: Na/Pi symporter [Pseudomonadales bacterium]
MVWLLVLFLVYTLLIGVGVIGDGFKWLSGGKEGAAAIFEFAGNPIVGVILGILATALVQSSSTVTSVIVGLVAGGVPVSVAVPMIMGANMGTTITNTIVSLGNLRDRAAFGKSFEAATVHDFFNLYSILIFLPIEIMFHPLERLGGAMAGWFYSDGSASMSGLNFMGAITKPLSGLIIDGLHYLPASVGPFLAIMIGISLIIASVILLGNLLKNIMTGRAQSIIDTAVGRGPLMGIFSGTIVTVLVQSSSTTTSLVVPLAGAGVLTTRQVYPFSMGANIGTCITALLAATAVAGEAGVVALQIALVHLMYNVFGVVVFQFVPWVKNTPLWSAHWLGSRVVLNRGWAIAYILAVFFCLPGTVFAAETYFRKPALNSDKAEEIAEELENSGVVIE